MRIWFFVSWVFFVEGFSPWKGFFPRYNTLLLDHPSRKYPFSQKYFERYIKQLNSKNLTEQTEALLADSMPEMDKNTSQPRIRIIINRDILNPFLNLEEAFYGEGDMPFIGESEKSDEDEHEDDYEVYRKKRRVKGRSAKSDHFELIEKIGMDFRDVGGYDVIKDELEQCVDLLKNHTKYARFNV